MSKIVSERHGITYTDFMVLLMTGKIVDGRAGGFLFGRSHADGGIPVIQRQDDDTFSITAEFEGGEYLVNWRAYQAAESRIIEINSHKENKVIELLSPVITRNSRLLNVHASPSDKLIWVDRRVQFVINKTATFRYFAEIEELNERHNSFADFDIMKTLNGME